MHSKLPLLKSDTNTISTSVSLRSGSQTLLPHPTIIDMTCDYTLAYHCYFSMFSFISHQSEHTSVPVDDQEKKNDQRKSAFDIMYSSTSASKEIGPPPSLSKKKDNNSRS
uniref:Uncharacterized protein n=1 Tax=Glossina pallidipes TaxID=7398 RepID=A0A1B0A7Z6_GLOPL